MRCAVNMVPIAILVAIESVAATLVSLVHSVFVPLLIVGAVCVIISRATWMFNTVRRTGITADLSKVVNLSHATRRAASICLKSFARFRRERLDGIRSGANTSTASATKTERTRTKTKRKLKQVDNVGKTITHNRASTSIRFKRLATDLPSIFGPASGAPMNIVERLVAKFRAAQTIPVANSIPIEEFAAKPLPASGLVVEQPASPRISVGTVASVSEEDELDRHIPGAIPLIVVSDHSMPASPVKGSSDEPSSRAQTEISLEHLSVPGPLAANLYRKSSGNVVLSTTMETSASIVVKNIRAALARAQELIAIDNAIEDAIKRVTSGSKKGSTQGVSVEGRMLNKALPAFTATVTSVPSVANARGRGARDPVPVRPSILPGISHPGSQPPGVSHPGVPPPVMRPAIVLLPSIIPPQPIRSYRPPLYPIPANNRDLSASIRPPLQAVLQNAHRPLEASATTFVPSSGALTAQERGPNVSSAAMPSRTLRRMPSMHLDPTPGCPPPNGIPGTAVPAAVTHINPVFPAAQTGAELEVISICAPNTREVRNSDTPASARTWSKIVGFERQMAKEKSVGKA